MFFPISLHGKIAENMVTVPNGTGGAGAAFPPAIRRIPLLVPVSRRVNGVAAMAGSSSPARCA